MAVETVCPGVHRIGGPGISDPEDCCVYLIEGEGELAVIDAGLGPSVPLLLENIRTLGFDPRQVRFLIATHGHVDHAGGLAALKTATGASVAAHKLELEAIQEGRADLTAASRYGAAYEPVNVDLVFSQDREILVLGSRQITVIHAPGHTRGSVVVVGNFGTELVLFGQDVHGPLNPAWGSDLALWRRSARMLMELDADVLCEGHFGVYRPREKVRRFIERCLEANGGG